MNVTLRQDTCTSVEPGSRDEKHAMYFIPRHGAAPAWLQHGSRGQGVARPCTCLCGGSRRGREVALEAGLHPPTPGTLVIPSSWRRPPTAAPLGPHPQTHPRYPPPDPPPHCSIPKGWGDVPPCPAAPGAPLHSTPWPAAPPRSSPGGGRGGGKKMEYLQRRYPRLAPSRPLVDLVSTHSACVRWL